MLLQFIPSHRKMAVQSSIVYVLICYAVEIILPVLGGGGGGGGGGGMW